MRTVMADMQSLDRDIRKSANMRMGLIRDTNMAAAGLGVAALAGLGSFVKVGAEFDYTMTTVKAVTGETEGTMNRLGKTARQLGKDTMFSGRDVASGMKFLAQSGYNAKQIESSITSAVHLAAATNVDVGGKLGSSDVLSSVLAAFGANTTDPREVQRYADVLTKGTLTSKTELPDLFESLKYSQATLKSAGIQIEEAVALTGTLAQAGLRGSMGGVALENTVRYITRAMGESRTGRQGAALSALGLDPSELRDAKGEMLSMMEISKIMASKLKGMTGPDRINIVGDLFGVRGARAANAFIDKLSEIDRIFNEVKYNSAGVAENVSKMKMESLWGHIDRVKSVAEDFAVTWTMGIQPVLKIGLKIVENILNVVTAISAIPFVGPFVTTAITTLVTIKTLKFAYRAIVATIAPLYVKNGVAAATSGASTVSWWNRMTAAAVGYNAAAQRASYTTAAMGAATAYKGPMYSPLGVPFTLTPGMRLTKSGRFYQSPQGPGLVGRFVSGATIIQGSHMRGYAAARGHSVLGTQMGKGAGLFSRAGLGVLASRGVGLLAKIGPSLLNLGRGLLGDPTAWIMLGVSLISALKSNTKSTDDNTEEVQAKNLRVKFDDAYMNSQNNLESRRYDVNNALAERMHRAMFPQGYEEWVAKYNGNHDYKQGRVVTAIDVWIDNQKAVKRAVEEKEFNDLYN